MTTMRQEVLDYVAGTYHGEAELPSLRDPSWVGFRHPDNRKWYALLGTVPGSRLGLEGEKTVDVLSVRLEDPLLRDFLLKREGFFPDLRSAAGNRITVLLDGTVPLSEIRSLIDTSYRITASAQTRMKVRAPKEWIVPSNPKYYDSVHAFDDTDEIRWKQGSGIRTGDIVFLYVGAPISAVLFKCVVTETDIPYQFRTEGLTISKLMGIRLLKRYDPAQFTFEALRERYGVFAVRGPRGIPGGLSEALDKAEPWKGRIG